MFHAKSYIRLEKKFMSGRYPTKGSSGQVQSMKSMDVRRLWDKLHNSDYRDNCFTYYREASFEKESAPTQRNSGQFGGQRRQPSTKNMSLLRRLSVNSTEKRVILAVAGVLGLGIGITRALAYGSQTSPTQRVDSYVDSLRSDWEKYQENIAK